MCLRGGCCFCCTFAHIKDVLPIGIFNRLSGLHHSVIRGRRHFVLKGRRLSGDEVSLILLLLPRTENNYKKADTNDHYTVNKNPEIFILLALPVFGNVIAHYFRLGMIRAQFKTSSVVIRRARPIPFAITGNSPVFVGLTLVLL